MVRSAAVVLGLTMAVPAGAGAATITAASCTRSAVQAAINSAAPADTVVVPDGSCAWTAGVIIDSKPIHLKAQNPGGTTLINNAGQAPLIDINEAVSGTISVSHFAFVGGSGVAHVILVSAMPNGKPALIHDNSFTGSINAIRMETNRGVIWSNTINTNKLDKSFVQCKPEGLGIASYESPPTMGTEDLTGQANLYVEDNTIVRVPLQSFDPDGNCRIVIRYNTFDNSGMSSHGPDTGPYGVRHFELYNNTFSFTNFGDCDGSQTVALPYLFFIRGGSGVIADNVIPNLQSCAWGDKPEILMTVMNLRRASGPFPCWNQGWPAPRQVGQGHNGIVPVTERLYLWGNTGGGNYDAPDMENYSPDECGGKEVSEYLQEGRDFVSGTPKPGYAKYPYPHPLRLATTSTVPTAPTDVRVVTQ